MLGKARFDVGGRTEGVSGSESTRHDDDIEPFAFHAMCSEVYETIANQVNVAAWIDLTAMDTTLAFTAVLNRQPYLGVVLTAEHQKWFEDKVAELFFHSLADTNNENFYNRRFAELMHAVDSGTPPPKNTPKAKAKSAGQPTSATRTKTSATGMKSRNKEEELRQKLKQLQGAAEAEDDDDLEEVEEQ